MKPSWATEMVVMSWELVNLPTNTIWRAKNTAERSVSHSPGPSEGRMSSPSEMSAIPAMLRTAAARLDAPGRLRTTAQLRNGTSTQYVAVRKALLPGVV